MGKLTAGENPQAAASDEALMEAYAHRGDVAAFGQIYDRWSDRLFSYIARTVDRTTGARRRDPGGTAARGVLDAALTVAYFSFVNRLVLLLGVHVEQDFQVTCRPALQEDR
jgi:hypothetical protein